MTLFLHGRVRNNNNNTLLTWERGLRGLGKTAEIGKTSLTMPELFQLYEEEPGEGRPAPLPEVEGRRVQRHTVEQILETFVPVPMLDLDVPMPQMVDQLVLKFFDTLVPAVERDIEVPGFFCRTTSHREPRSGSRSWWNSWWKCQHSLFFVEETVVSPDPDVGGRLADLQGFLPEQSWRSSRCSAACVGGHLHSFPQDKFQQRHPQFLSNCSARRRG